MESAEKFYSEICDRYSAAMSSGDYIAAAGVAKEVTGRTKKSFTVSTKYYPSRGGKNAVIVWNELAKLGWSPEATACIMGCIWNESRFHVGAVNSRDGGWGLCQWTNTRGPYGVSYRKNRALNWCKSHGGYGAHVQAAYLNYEMKHSYPKVYKYHAKRGSLEAIMDHICRFESYYLYKYKHCNYRIYGFNWHGMYYVRLRDANYYYSWFASRRSK